MAAFKEALGLDDEEAAPVFIEVCAWGSHGARMGFAWGAHAPALDRFGTCAPLPAAPRLPAQRLPGVPGPARRKPAPLLPLRRWAAA